MPLPVRVDPFGDLHALAERGAWFGNRGCLHDHGTEPRRSWALRAWIICRLEFKDWHRDVMPPGRYTGLFFRDEASALAAGHRPCFECRRADARAFVAAAGFTRAGDLDRALHAERLVDGAKPRHPLAGQRATHPVPAGDLPAGTVLLDDTGPLVVGEDGRLRAWTFSGPLAPRRPTGDLRLLTPPTTVTALRAGYRPSDGGPFLT